MFYGYLAAKGSWHGEARDLQIAWWKNFHTFFSAEEEVLFLQETDSCDVLNFLPLMHQKIAVGDRLCGSIASQGPGHVLGYHPPKWTDSVDSSVNFITYFYWPQRIQIFQHIIDIGV